MSTPETRALVLDLIDEAVDAGARLTPACAVVGLTPRTLRRWRALAGSDSGLVDRRTCTPRVPANRLSPEEQEAILAVCNEPEYRSLPPTQIVPRLADQGVYIASESSFYRVLRAHDQVHRRGRAAAPRRVPKPEGVCATAPNAAIGADTGESEEGCTVRIALSALLFRQNRGFFREPACVHEEPLLSMVSLVSKTAQVLIKDADKACSTGEVAFGFRARAHAWKKVHCVLDTS